MIIEIFGIIGIVLLLFIMDRLIRKNKINFNFVYLNYFMLLFFILLLLLFLIPQVETFILIYTKFILRDFIVAIAIIYLFYATFIQSLIIANQNKKIETIVTNISVKIAIDEEKNEKN